MKKIGFILLIVLLLALGGVAWYEEARLKPFRERNEEAAKKIRETDAYIAKTQAMIAAWRRCHTDPPTTKEDRDTCKKLDEWAAANASKD